MEKVSQESAKYRSYANGNEACAKCTMFRPLNSCITVRGYISPFGWCKFFKRKRHLPKQRKGDVRRGPGYKGAD